MKQEPDAVPRSTFDLTGGIVYFARMIDKIRLHAAGKVRPDFHANLGDGFDGRRTGAANEAGVGMTTTGLPWAVGCGRLRAMGTPADLEVGRKGGK
jgi:hypothetical protein